MKPVVASYVADFLKPEMRHVYRQITGQKNVTPWVLTHKRENAEWFPFPRKRLTVLPKPKLRWWRRFLHKNIKNTPWQLYPWEVKHALLTLTRAEAKALHVYFGHMALHLMPLLKVFPRPVIVSYHGADAGVDINKPGQLAAMQEVFKVADRIQARSSSLADDLVKLGCPREKIRIQRTGIPLHEWPFHHRAPAQDGAWRILQSCRLIPKKGLDITLHAFAELKKSYPAASLTISGEGPLLAELQELAAALGVAPAVRFTGFLSQHELHVEMHRCQMFVHPSRMGADGNREGVPNSMLEAMASGLPIIATNHGGIPEAVKHELSGLLVDENDAPALTTAMLRIIQEPHMTHGIVANGRRAVETVFDQAQNIAILEQDYLDLIEDYAERPRAARG